MLIAPSGAVVWRRKHRKPSHALRAKRTSFSDALKGVFLHHREGNLITGNPLSAYGDVSDTTVPQGRGIRFNDAASPYLRTGRSFFSGSEARSVVFGGYFGTSYTDTYPTLFSQGVSTTQQRWDVCLDTTASNALNIQLQGPSYTSATLLMTAGYHIVQVDFSGTQLQHHTLYLDGISDAASGSASVNTATTYGFTLGQSIQLEESAATDRSFGGVMLFCYVFSGRILTPTERGLILDDPYFFLSPRKDLIDSLSAFYPVTAPTYTRVLADSINVSDSLSQRSLLNRLLESYTLDLFLGTSTSSSLSRRIIDESLTDFYSALTQTIFSGGSANIVRILSDSIEVSDNYTYLVQYSRSISDSIEIQQALTVLLFLYRLTMSDVETFSDVAGVISTFLYRLLEENIAVLSGISEVSFLSRLQSDSVDVSYDVSVIQKLIRTYAENVDVSSNLTQEVFKLLKDYIRVVYGLSPDNIVFANRTTTLTSVDTSKTKFGLTT